MLTAKHREERDCSCKNNFTTAVRCPGIQGERRGAAVPNRTEIVFSLCWTEDTLPVGTGTSFDTVIEDPTPFRATPAGTPKGSLPKGAAVPAGRDSKPTGESGNLSRDFHALGIGSRTIRTRLSQSAVLETDGGQQAKPSRRPLGLLLTLSSFIRTSAAHLNHALRSPGRASLPPHAPYRLVPEKSRSAATSTQHARMAQERRGSSRPRSTCRRRGCCPASPPLMVRERAAGGRSSPARCRGRRAAAPPPREGVPAAGRRRGGGKKLLGGAAPGTALGAHRAGRADSVPVHLARPPPALSTPLRAVLGPGASLLAKWQRSAFAPRAYRFAFNLFSSRHFCLAVVGGPPQACAHTLAHVTALPRCVLYVPYTSPPHPFIFPPQDRRKVLPITLSSHGTNFLNSLPSYFPSSHCLGLHARPASAP